MSEKKINKKVLGIIIAIIVILLIVAIIGGIFVFKTANSTETEWGNYYYQTLSSESKKYEAEVQNENGEKETKEFDEYADTRNTNIQFIQLKEDMEPIMIVSFERENAKKSVNIYSINKDSNGNKYATAYNCYPEISSTNPNDFKVEYDAILLYNIVAREYRWYIREISENGNVLFLDLLMNSRNPSYDNLDKKEDLKESYSFTAEEMKTNQVLEDGTPILSKFEETFIVVDNIDKTIEIGDIHNIDEKVLKEHIKSAEKQYKDINSIITEEIKIATENKIAELENKKEQIKVAQEEKNKKETEEKAKAEEEAKKKAEEEAKKGLKAGNYTLKYGKYTGTSYDEGTGGFDSGVVPTYTTTYTLKSDGTYTYSSTNGASASGTYKVINLSSMGSYYNGQYGIEFSNGTKLSVPSNNTLQVLAGATEKFTYQGN